MRPELKPSAESLLQARVDGKLNSTNDILGALITGPNGIPVQHLMELNSFVQEVLDPSCSTIPGAQAVADKYELKITT